MVWHCFKKGRKEMGGGTEEESGKESLMVPAVCRQMIENLSHGDLILDKLRYLFWYLISIIFRPGPFEKPYYNILDFNITESVFGRYCNFCFHLNRLFLNKNNETTTGTCVHENLFEGGKPSERAGFHSSGGTKAAFMRPVKAALFPNIFRTPKVMRCSVEIFF
ncbi:hypothetical protein CDAR_455941 [Caerostris darwini]|uniref:LAGLIDADG homing endonuclease n=1 Tax=Caerostris darwini TaxID=1538125 RepID=A0AAV4RJX0_9ARAC|nr:hypothetical protein CDAR_455941 [Caerostris darwini]